MIGEAVRGSTQERDALDRIEAYLRAEQERRQLFGAAGRIDQVAEWGGGHFDYAYDGYGDLTAIREANGRRRRYAYDGRRRLHKVEHGDGSATGYAYDGQDRLETIDDRGTMTRYDYDAQGRIARIQHGQSEVSVYRYDDSGRVVQARTSQVSTQWRHDAGGRTTLIEQSIGGVTLRVQLAYDLEGRLATMTLPGSDCPIHYGWDERGRPHTVRIGQRMLARFAYDDGQKATFVTLGNGITTSTKADALDGRLRSHVVKHGDRVLLSRTLRYGERGELVGDGEQCFEYDRLGRLTEVRSEADETAYRFRYDDMDNLVERTGLDQTWKFNCDAAGQLLAASEEKGAQIHFAYDRWGRLTQRDTPDGLWTYRYDDAGQLQEVRRNHQRTARFLYDHKGRLVWTEVEGAVERYLYGDADELLAVTDGDGHPLRLIVRTPLGVVAEVQGALGDGAILYRHDDERGTTRVLTDATGEVVARFAYDPFGLPTGAPLAGKHLPCFTGRRWYAAIGLYYFGARWYDPALGRFLTPDSYTGAPDDARLLSPIHLASGQAALRSQILAEWLKQPARAQRVCLLRQRSCGTCRSQRTLVLWGRAVDVAGRDLDAAQHDFWHIGRDYLPGRRGDPLAGLALQRRQRHLEDAGV